MSGQGPILFRSQRKFSRARHVERSFLRRNCFGGRGARRSGRSQTQI